MKLKTTVGRFYRLAPFVRPYFRTIALVFVLSTFGTVLGLVWPLFMKILIDDVLVGRDHSLLLRLCGLIAGVTAIGYVVGGINRYLYTRVTANVLFSLRQHLFSHLQGLSVRFHSKNRVGDLLSRLNTDIAEIQGILTDALFTFVTNVFLLLATNAFLIWLNPKLFLVGLIVVPAQIYAVRKVRPYIVTETRKVRELNATISSFLVESLTAIKFIKQFTSEQLQLQRLRKLGEGFVTLVTRYEMLAFIANTSAAATTFVGSILVMLYGGYLVIDGEMSIGALVAFSAYQSRAFGPVQVLMDLYLRIERAAVSVDRVFEFLDVGQEFLEQSGGTLQKVPLIGKIEFRSVSFHYETDRPIFQDVSFIVPAGRQLTILGVSGAGKSTLTELLIRLHEPHTGSIAIDGSNIRDFDLEWLRRQVLVLGPEPFLFHASIEDNILYGKPEASRAECIAASKTVGLHEIVLPLPEQYESTVGERGTQLSVGQRQRVALARAVLRKPRVLVLDEAMSGLEPASEAELRASLSMTIPDATTIVVTHRVDSVGDREAVLLISGGQVVWQGTCGDLRARPELLQEVIAQPQ